MASKETQSRIISKSIELYNQHGTRSISTNRIADECEISRGNLHYHFRTKEEIIQAIFSQIDKQMDEHWYDDHLHPTLEHMHLMFSRQMKMIWDYRFFYRELTTLLHNDPHLKTRFMDNRRKRVREVAAFFKAMLDAGMIEVKNGQAEFDSLILISWLISDQWLPYLDMNDLELNEESVRKGFDLIFQILEPCFTAKANQGMQHLLQKNRDSDRQLH